MAAATCRCVLTGVSEQLLERVHPTASPGRAGNCLLVTLTRHQQAIEEGRIAACVECDESGPKNAKWREFRRLDGPGAPSRSRTRVLASLRCVASKPDDTWRHLQGASAEAPFRKSVAAPPRVAR